VLAHVCLPQRDATSASNSTGSGCLTINTK
jgi:hypothetical protein